GHPPPWSGGPPPPPRPSPASPAAATSRRAVLRSPPACAAAVRSPAPASHARSTSLISVTATSRNAIPRTPKSVDLKAPGTGSDQDPQAGAPGGPITGNRVVPCSWQKTPKGGPMLVAGDMCRRPLVLPRLASVHQSLDRRLLAPPRWARQQPATHA